MSSAKADVLARIRGALGAAPTVPDVPRAYRAAGSLPTEGIVEAFCENVAEYRATVHRIAPDELPATVASLLAGFERVGVPPGFRDIGVEAIEDTGLSVAELDTLDAVVTGSALAIADTGTIVLDSGPASGRRALTLVPDLHVCIVEATDVVPSVPDAIARLAAAADRPITFVSGPSATSDIELDRVEGVHGPRVLHVILLIPPSGL
ncbi:LutC/YkgG family protein [Solirubrobacter soli]|uniref:LutC/YkgG family protein n=1 Tax=Solirubrobacter soli TaxID=363832 RepID=UPI000420B1B4|nr:LUD domain-containing protein [Solirubrobacter soli]